MSENVKPKSCANCKWVTQSGGPFFGNCLIAESWHDNDELSKLETIGLRCDSWREVSE